MKMTYNDMLIEVIRKYGHESENAIRFADCIDGLTNSETDRKYAELCYKIAIKYEMTPLDKRSNL